MSLTDISRLARQGVAVGILTLIAACAVGPNFKKPAPPEIGEYTAHPLETTAATPDTTGGPAQHFAAGADISADWWTLFHSAPLSALIEQSLKNNPDLKAARAALSVARENVLAQRGAYYPSVATDFAATRQKLSGQISPTLNSNAFLYNLFTPEVTVSFLPDVFGLNRRTVESLQAQEQGVRFQMVATYTTLTANVVVTAIQESSLQQQVDVTRALIDSNTKAVDILKYQLDKGYASRLDLAAQESQLAQITATLPPLVKQLAQLHDLLAALTGQFPRQLPDEHIDLAALALPEEIPVGSSAAAMSQLFTSGTGFWGVGVDAAMPIFQGGTLLHQERAAKAAYAEAAEQYRSAVLAAVQNVADTLTALQQDADALKAAKAAAAAAQTTLDLAQRQWQGGYAGYLAFLSAGQANQQSQINLVQAEASRFADTAALFQALGGGWWNRADVAMDK